MGSGTILREVMAAKPCCSKDWGVAPTSGACPSFNELARRRPTASAGTCCTPPTRRACPSWRSQLEGHAGPVIASTDYMKLYAEQIRAFVPKGRTLQGAGHRRLRPQDFRQLREHFEVNRHYVVVAALKALADEGTVPLKPRWPKRSRSTASTPTNPTRCTREASRRRQATWR
jgi:pyruvate dehydrogenase E1 component